MLLDIFLKLIFPLNLNHLIRLHSYIILSCIIFMDPMEDQLGHVDRAEYGLSIRFFNCLYGNKYLLTYTMALA